MTPTEKRYLLFLSPRTPRPKQCDRPSAKTLKAMEAMGWIAVSMPRPKFGPCNFHIMPPGEAALDAEEAKAPVDRSAVLWRPMASMPEGHTVLITDGTLVRTGVRDGDTIIAGVVTPIGMWLLWAPMPSVPLVAMAARGAA